jgi:hypothetical protein
VHIHLLAELSCSAAEELRFLAGLTRPPYLVTDEDLITPQRSEPIVPARKQMRMSVPAVQLFLHTSFK